MQMNDEFDLWAYGWAFYKGDGSKSLMPTVEDCTEWMQGFCIAMADYDIEKADASIQEALVNKGVEGELLESCLASAELIFQSEEWQRVPDVPIRVC